jgi:streptogrisin C
MLSTLKVSGVGVVAAGLIALSPVASFAAEARQGTAAAVQAPDGAVVSTDPPAVIEQRLRAQLGATFAGAWIPAGSDRLMVAVTDASASAEVLAAGADVTVVKHSEATLNAALNALNSRSAKASPADVYGWYVDVPGNIVVVEVRPGAEAAALAFVRCSGVAAELVRVVEVAQAPVPLPGPGLALR